MFFQRLLEWNCLELKKLWQKELVEVLMFGFKIGHMGDYVIKLCLSPLFCPVEKSIKSTKKWYLQPIVFDMVENELRGNS